MKLTKVMYQGSTMGNFRLLHDLDSNHIGGTGFRKATIKEKKKYIYIYIFVRIIRLQKIYIYIYICQDNILRQSSVIDLLFIIAY